MSVDKSVWITLHRLKVRRDNVPLPLPGAYLLTNTHDGKQYVGVSWDIRRRLQDHQGMHGSSPLATAKQLHGLSVFRAEPVFYVTDGRILLHARRTSERRRLSEALRDIEVALIIAYDTMEPKGYNVILGDTTQEGVERSTAYAERLADSRRTPEVAAKRRAIFNSKEFKGKVGEKSRAAWQKPGAHDARSETIRRAWSDPGLREKHSKLLRAFYASSEGIARRHELVVRSIEVNAQPEVKERISASISALIWITDGATSERISKDAMIPNGWRRGRAPSEKGYGPQRGIIRFQWITNGNENKQISIDEPVPDDWQRGLFMIRRPAMPKRWVNNGSEMTQLSVDEPIPEGWLLGRAPDKKGGRKPEGKPQPQRWSMWINDGTMNTVIAITDVIPDGWHRGRTGYKRSAVKSASVTS